MRETEVGLLPADWRVLTIQRLASRSPNSTVGGPFGSELVSRDYVENGVPVIRGQNLARAYVGGDFVFVTKAKAKALSSNTARPGDLVFTQRGTLGQVSLVPSGRYSTYIISQSQMKLTPDVSLAVPEYLLQWFRGSAGQRTILDSAIQTGVPHTNLGILRAYQVPVPPLGEQRAIAAALSDADALIEALNSLIAKKRAIKQGAMQDLLSGRRRLPAFNGEWSVRRIADIAIPSIEKNTSNLSLPVLTCSKHLGFVDSLGYFKNQVFSRDLRGYRIIRRGEIGYPANHLEEGSIGLQDLYDVAVVSPIYVVFSTKEGVDSYFVHRLLKLEEYRRKFASATSASVDRRGSLRWGAFSQIEVSIPPSKEQTAIVNVLSDMEAEIAALEERMSKARQIKQGMMQELLGGRTRLA
jgi:type I restriction enzyme S subunit